MSAHSKYCLTHDLKKAIVMRIHFGVFQINVTDGFRLCRTQSVDIEQSMNVDELHMISDKHNEGTPFSVNVEALHTIVQKHKDGRITIMPYNNEVHITFDDGVEYKLQNLTLPGADYICDMEPHPNTRWAQFNTKELRNIFKGWREEEACYLHMNGTLQIKRMREVVHEQPCDFGAEIFVEVNPRYLAAAIKEMGRVGYLGLHKSRVCVSDTKAELPMYMHIIQPMKDGKYK